MSRVDRQVEDRRIHLRLREVFGRERQVDFTAEVLRRLNEPATPETATLAPVASGPTTRGRWAALVAPVFGVAVVWAVLFSSRDADPAQNKKWRDNRPIEVLVQELRQGNHRVTHELVRRGVKSVDALLAAIDTEPNTVLAKDEAANRVGSELATLRRTLASMTPKHPNYAALRRRVLKLDAMLEGRAQTEPQAWVADAMAVIRRIGPAAAARINQLQARLPKLVEARIPDLMFTLGDLAPYAADYKFVSQVQKGKDGKITVVDRIRTSRGRAMARHLEFVDRLNRRCALREETSLASIERLPRSDYVAFEWALEQLPRHGAAGRHFAPSIAKILHGDLPKGVLDARSVMTRAARAMLAIGGGEAALRKAHEHLLIDGEETEQVTAIQAIRAAGDFTNANVQTMLQLAQTATPLVVREAVVTLGIIGPPAAAAVPALQKLADGQDRAHAAVARAALKRIQN